MLDQEKDRKRDRGTSDDERDPMMEREEDERGEQTDREDSEGEPVTVPRTGRRENPQGSTRKKK